MGFIEMLSFCSELDSVALRSAIAILANKNQVTLSWPKTIFTQQRLY